MAVLHEYSTQYTNSYVTVPMVANHPTEDGGVMMIKYFKHAFSATADVTSDVALCKLPPGQVRLLLPLSWIYINWTTGSATLDLGWDAYTDMDGATVTADPDGLVDGLDVDTVGFRNFVGNATGALNTNFTTAGVEALGGTYLFNSKSGVVIRATSQDVAEVSADSIQGFLTYVQV